jgi:hypothetical protein
MVDQNGEINISQEWALLNDYNTVYILKKTKGNDGDKYEITSTPLYVNKPDLPDIKNAFSVYFVGQSKTINIYAKYQHPTTKNNFYLGEAKYITKIGLINDKDILKKFANGEEPYQELLNYAKTAEGQTYTLSSVNSYDGVKASDLNVVKNAYYYVYTRFTDSGGLYRNMEGINIAKEHDGFIMGDVDYSDMASTTLQSNYIVLLISLFIIGIIIGIVLFNIIKKNKNKNTYNSFTRF